MQRSGPRRRLSPLIGLAVALAGGCAASRNVYRERIGGELSPGAVAGLRAFGTARAAAAESAGTCRASHHVRVLDRAGRPVPSARVTVEETTSDHAIEETLAVYRWFTDPVVTDSRGEARICDPDELPSLPSIQGIGGG